MVHPPSTKGHKLVLVDYFTKWVEAMSMKEVIQAKIIDFIEELIIHRFVIPPTVTTGQETMFTGQQVEGYTESKGIKLIHSTPYYAQVNGQVDVVNKTLIKLIKEHIGRQSQNWHNTLSQVWAYRCSSREATGLTPYKLVYGHKAVLPLKINLQTVRVTKQNDLPVE
ncbi:uncharacterized protein LOC130957367 [Arachis stenosperma]|uniref:uncharacterized protein LOC130957367 n=1 Tax=Arachis stenosperma TaxID=217475 RepID=UPI0025ACCA14|nr:uncharacterized protein LOC130957367 [Arachis stenosperma]